MQNILIGKVETDPLIHYGGLFNTFEAMIILSLFSFILFIPFIRENRYKNFLFFVFMVLPILNMYYRNTHQFVGGVFLGHLLFIIGIVLAMYLINAGFGHTDEIYVLLLRKRKILLGIIIGIFILRAVFVFGSRPTDSGIFSGIGGILYLYGSSMFRDYWGVVSIGARYGPALYLAYLPFVPIAYVTKYFLWGDSLTPWNSVSNVPLAVATSYTGALFYEGLILFLLIRMFKRFGLYAALLYMLNPLNSLILSVNANEIPQTAFFLLGLYLINKPVFSSISLVFSSMMKIYPALCSIPFTLFYTGKARLKFLFSFVSTFAIFFIYWLYEASLAPEELRTNPIRDILFYQKDPGKFHSIWYFTDHFLSPAVSYILMGIFLFITVCLIFRILKHHKEDSFAFLRLSILAIAAIIIINRSVHPGYYYFLQNLLFLLFFSEAECGWNIKNGQANS